jgi:hypothetical protein
MSDFERAIEHALSGEAILFLGAGFSSGATNLLNASVKTSHQLARLLSSEVSFPLDTPLDEASGEYINKNGLDSFLAYLQTEFTVKDVADSHLDICRVPWFRIYTTNYDNVVELSLSKLSIPYFSVIPSDQKRDIPRNSILCIHLNGFIGRVTKGSFYSDLVLTSHSYDSSVLNDSFALRLFRNDLLTARAIFFVGYSLYDIDIRRILFSTQHLQHKSYFVLYSDDIAQQRRLSSRVSNYGRMLQMSSEDFAHILSHKYFSYSPIPKTHKYGYCISKCQPPKDIRPLKDKNIFELLLLGDVSYEHVYSSIISDSIGKKYYLFREDKSLAILNCKSTVIVLHSDLGNGKSLFLEGLKIFMTNNNKCVFSVEKRSEGIFEELDDIVSNNKDVYFVIDDYPEWLDVIEYLSNTNKCNISYILTARSTLHDVMIRRLAQIVNNDNITEISIDNLNARDIEWIVSFLDEYGLWGNKAAWGPERKIGYLKNKCNSQYHAILLDILKSTNILDKFSNIMEELQNKAGNYDIMVCIFVLAVINIGASINTLIDIWGYRITDASFSRDIAVRQLLDIEYGNIRLRSSVAAKYMLQEVVNSDIISEVVIKMMQNADKEYYNSDYYKAMMKNLTRFGNLQLFINSKVIKKAIFEIYEHAKRLNSCKTNPQFWLQYAIAALFMDDVERAEKYFETAYSYASKIEGYDTFMIDNHYARMLLRKSVECNDANSGMTYFRNARRILNEQFVRERIYYPYLVAEKYREFYEAYESIFGNKERDEIMRAVKFVKKQISLLPNERRMNKYVEECEVSMEIISESIMKKT